MEFKEAIVTSATVEPTQAKRTSVSASERQRYVALWQQSGLSGAKFCETQGLNIKTFGNWKRKYGNTKCSSSAQAQPKKASQGLKCSAIKLQLPNGVSMMLNTEISDAHAFLSILKEVATWNCN